MTPKEKAEQLVNKYFRDINLDWYDAIECALIAVEEIIKSEPSQKGMIMGGVQLRYLTIDYWQEVKQEIEKL